MFRIKQVAEDFVVDEDYQFPSVKPGQYSYFILRKSGMTTHRAVELIAERAFVPGKSVGYAGLKDKAAVTSQLVSVRGVGKRFAEMRIPGISLEFVGTGDTPLTLGLLKGNRFRIAVRNLGDKDCSRLAQRAALLERMEFRFPNYFGSQRFGSANHLVGRAIVSGDFRAAVEGAMIKGSDSHLSHHPNDYVGSLKSAGRRMLSLYVHSFQSLLFNEALAGLCRQMNCFSCSYSAGSYFFPDALEPWGMIPLVGFATELHEYPQEVNHAVESVLAGHGIRLSDFIIRSIPLLSCEGSERAAYASACGFRMEFAEDELNSGMRKCVLRFSLGKGSYATVLLDFLLQPK
ncbi:MAG: tRNA pseudouridine(13) synthase TruD [Candidatus Diapherotrites archaeon]|uniref:tRNA pseudouridine(13) synthase TruD n=1 Tax=Candidatus Iainarchaeum sp. TaxID=3101447 RepID=A0A8T3YPQ4_9ARCH|nr:tRNA pseudouridine(13) synthase TruD [Candidatus Diapherotrites archaeon]